DSLLFNNLKRYKSMHFFYGCRRRRPLPSMLRKLLLVMKLTVVFLTVVSLGISARSFSQPITYNGKHVSLEKAFSIIQQQTGYTFFYNDAAIAATEAVTVSFKDVDLRTALDKLLKGQHLSYTIQGKTIFVHESAGRGLPEETMV